jgi:hypothetical protein
LLCLNIDVNDVVEFLLKAFSKLMGFYESLEKVSWHLRLLDSFFASLIRKEIQNLGRLLFHQTLLNHEILNHIFFQLHKTVCFKVECLFSLKLTIISMAHSIKIIVNYVVGFLISGWRIAISKGLSGRNQKALSSILLAKKYDFAILFSFPIQLGHCRYL